MKNVTISRLTRTINWDFFAKNIQIDIFNDLLTSEEEIRIDLRNINSIYADGILWIDFIALYRYLNNLQMTVIYPKNKYRSGYLKFLGFESVLNHLAVKTYKWFDEESTDIYQTNNANKAFLKNQILINPRNLPQLSFSISEALELYLQEILNKKPVSAEMINKIDEGTILIRGFSKIVLEIMENIVQHGGFLKDQGVGVINLCPPAVWSGTYPITFTDCGKGLVFRFLEELNKYKNESEVQDALTDISSNPEGTSNYYKRIIAYILLYGYYRPLKKYIGFYRILPFFSLFKAKLSIRSDCFFANIDFSSTNFYYFLEKHSNPTISWIEKYIDIPTLPGLIPGTHINIMLTIPGKHEVRDKTIWKSLMHY
jgi:hypothetical protein